MQWLSEVWEEEGVGERVAEVNRVRRVWRRISRVCGAGAGAKALGGSGEDSHRRVFARLVLEQRETRVPRGRRRRMRVRVRK